MGIGNKPLAPPGSQKTFHKPVEAPKETTAPAKVAPTRPKPTSVPSQFESGADASKPLDARKGVKRNLSKGGAANRGSSLRERPVSNGPVPLDVSTDKTPATGSGSNELVPLHAPGPGNPSPMVPSNEVEAAREAHKAEGTRVTEQDLDGIRDKAHDIMSTPDNRKAADKLSDALQTSPSKEHRAALMKEIVTRNPRMAANIIGAADTLQHLHHDLSKGDQDIIAHSLGEAYDTGAIGQKDLNRMLQPHVHGLHRNPTALASMIGKTGSAQMQKDASAEMLKHAEADPSRNSGFYAGAAAAAAGSPEATNALLTELGGGERFDKFIAATRPKGLGTRGDLAFKPILPNLIKTASKVQPPNDNVRRLFDKGVRVVDGDKNMRSALGDYFRANPQDTTTRLAKTEGQTLDNQVSLTKFAEEVVFADGHKGQEETRNAWGNELNRRLLDMHSAGTPDDPAAKRELDEKARQFGHLVGSSEVGFKRALKHVKDKNAANKAMSDMIVDMVAGPAKEAIPFDVTLPGVGSVKDKSVEWVKEKISAHYQQAEPSPKEVLRPFSELGTMVPADQTDEVAAMAGRYHDFEDVAILE
jgi:hypothetical protein